MRPKVKKEPKPQLCGIRIEDTNTGEVISRYPATSKGERYADKFKGLAGIKIIKEYSLGGETYECN